MEIRAMKNKPEDKMEEKKIKQISLDLETYSDMDLAKCGVYKYASSPNAELLLFGYSVDGGEVQVVDLAKGEKIPGEIVRALADDTVLKWAFNASFERVFLSYWLHRHYPNLFSTSYLNPASWRCSMVWSAYLGLPLSLKGVGAVLGLDKQKMDEGKELIRYFCVPRTPTKTNTAIRNMPENAKEKWELFKFYNKRDVEVELGIKDKLKNFPVPDFVWEEYCIDQEINDRGVLIDEVLVDSAIEMDRKSKEELKEKMARITELENPNSVQQLSTWLGEMGVEVDSLGKKNVDKMINEASGEIKEVLLLRQQLAKSSVKKYQAMKNAVCADGRVRGMFSFYGANRTGRFSGKIVQMQNLRRNDLKDLDVARNLVKSGNMEAVDLLFSDVPDTLSQLIRTAFIPRPGCLFYVADYSAIECRVLAWLAGEQWVLDVFADGGDIYCATASKMFGVPVEKHGVNGELRQKGKQATLSCIAEGSLVLTDVGLVRIEEVTSSMKVWDGENWVEHEGVVFNGEREVITYEGLTATPDHLVWIEGEQEPVQFGIAASCRAHLVKTGDGRNPIRMGENHQSRKTMEQELEPLLCSDRVSGVRFDSVANVGQLENRKIKGLSGLFSAKTDSSMAEQKANSSKTTLREYKRSRISKLWSKGHKILLSFCDGCGSIFNRAIWSSRQIIRAGQNRYEWRLCTRESSICNTQRESFKSKKNGSIQIRSAILALQPKCGDSKTFQWRDQTRDNNGCGESGRTEKKKLATNIRKARLYDIRNAGPHHRFTVSDCLVHNCGYGGGVGAMIAMGAIDSGMKEEELQPMVDYWRQANPKIVKLWYEFDRAAKKAIKEKTTTDVRGIRFSYASGFLFMRLPSGRSLAYVKPRIGENRFGGESITYEGVGATKKWERLETFGGKLVENCVQAISRDILCHAMKNLRNERICMHIHDELVIECKEGTDLNEICERMAKVPDWAPGLILRADGYTCTSYRKD